MPKRSSKPTDLNARAAAIVAQATSDEPDTDPYKGKNPAAVELAGSVGRRAGRLGQRSSFSKKVENHAHAVSLHFFWYNFGRVHQSLRVQLENGKYQQRTPAMPAGVASFPWSVTQVAQLLD